MEKEQARELNKKLNGNTELKRAFDVFNADLEYYKECLKVHYKNIAFCEDKIARIEHNIDKCIEKAKEYGIQLTNNKKQ